MQQFFAQANVAFKVGMDLPGHAFTDSVPAARCSLDAMSESMAALLRELQCSPAVCVGLDHATADRASSREPARTWMNEGWICTRVWSAIRGTSLALCA